MSPPSWSLWNQLSGVNGRMRKRHLLENIQKSFWAVRVELSYFFERVSGGRIVRNPRHFFGRGTFSRHPEQRGEQNYVKQSKHCRRSSDGPLCDTRHNTSHLSSNVSHPEFCPAASYFSPDASHPGSVRHHPTFSGCLSSGICLPSFLPFSGCLSSGICPSTFRLIRMSLFRDMSGAIPPSPDVSHPESIRRHSYLSPNVSHSESVRRHSTLIRMSLIRNLSADIPLSPNVSHPEFHPAEIPPSLDVSHPTPDAGWERGEIQLPPSSMFGSSFYNFFF
uniref:Uncharacterized protein n=1 Tax=Vitis vinifera TaxID=29760 RepID=A5BH19_VITVI|nr:hypothetical protein VITISV_027760 [Vitis vinifera]